MLTESDKYKFAKSLLIGNATNIREKAIINAYPALQRTFRFKGRDHEKSLEKSKNILINFLSDLDDLKKNMESTSKEQIKEIYDCMHHQACDLIVTAFTSEGFECHYGQAQKWVNITMKHLVLYSNEYDDILFCFHIPIDNIVYEMAKKAFNIEKPTVAWSRMSYHDYIEYQEKLNKSIEEKYNHHFSPFEWEWVCWKSV